MKKKMICIRSYLTLTNETLSNNSNKSILTIITHGRNMEIGDHKIMEFILSNQRQKAIFFLLHETMFISLEVEPMVE